MSIDLLSDRSIFEVMIDILELFFDIYSVIKIYSLKTKMLN